MRTFEMFRDKDETGVSGTGKVLEGALFTDGTIVVRWLTDTPSTNIYPNLWAFAHLHIESHPTNGTHLVFNREEIEEFFTCHDFVCHHCEHLMSEHPRTDKGYRRACGGAPFLIVV